MSAPAGSPQRAASARTQPDLGGAAAAGAAARPGPAPPQQNAAGGRRPGFEVRGRMDAACEVKHRVVASPMGQIRISGCEQGLHGIKLLGRATQAAAPPEPAETPKPLAECAAWLHAYFREPAALRELPVPALHHPVFLRDSFTRQVLCKLQEAVEFGEVVSYQQLAALAGRPKAARAVGGAMRSNPVPILVPCHRVVCSGGAPGNYSGGGPAAKAWLLDHEGSLAGPRRGSSSSSEPAGQH